MANSTFNYFSFVPNLERVAGNFAIGINEQGDFVQDNLFRLPHLIITGATGSGKSVFVHDVIISLAINGGCCFRLIDLKRVELSMYNGCSFMVSDTITDAPTAERVLRYEVEEMENRYKLMERYRVRHYTKLPEHEKLQARVIVIDELADLMLNRDTRRSVENSVVRLAQLGRAAGVHLVLATQRPSREVLTGLIKANIPAKITFKTASATDSRVIGIKGAEHLQGRGDGLYGGNEIDNPEHIQAFYIFDDDLEQFAEGARPVKQSKMGFFQRLFR